METNTAQPKSINKNKKFSAEEIIVKNWRNLRWPKSFELKRWLERRYVRDYVICEDTSALVREEDAHQCELSKNYYEKDEDFLLFNVRETDCYGWFFTWKKAYKREVRKHCFYCDRSNEWYLTDHFSSVLVEGETVCFDKYHNAIYYWESDGQNHWNPEKDD